MYHVNDDNPASLFLPSRQFTVTSIPSFDFDEPAMRKRIDSLPIEDSRTAVKKTVQNSHVVE